MCSAVTSAAAGGRVLPATTPTTAEVPFIPSAGRRSRARGRAEQSPLPRASTTAEACICPSRSRPRWPKPLPLLVVASTAGQESSGSTAAAVSAIAERVLPDLLAAAERYKAGAPKDELVKLRFVARLGKVLFQCQPGGSPVSLDALRQAAKAWEVGSKSKLRKSFYTNMPRECLDDMERSMVKRMGLHFDSSKERYHVKVFDKNQSDSRISCKCTVEEDGSLAIQRVGLNEVRHLVEDISCIFKGLDLRLMLCKKRILKNLDSEVEDAVKSLVSAAVTDPNVKGGIRWPLGRESVGERFSIVGVWHTNCKAFRNKTMRLKLRHADRLDHRSSNGEVSDEVTFKLTAISRKLEQDDPVENSVKEMLESAVQMVWDNALNYKITPLSSVTVLQRIFLPWRCNAG